MGSSCCREDAACAAPPAYRRVLWAALAINVAMFAVEGLAGAKARSVSLWADSADFLADAANYGISLLVLSRAAALRARAALFKGFSLGAVGLLVASATAWRALTGNVPEAEVMGAVGLLALAANIGCALLLFAYREGDANMRSVWICSRNDAIGNLAVMLAALGVFGTKAGWPDLVVAAVLASLALSGAIQIVRHALRELRGRREGPTLESFVDEELAGFRRHRQVGRTREAWEALERAHVLAQPSAGLHTRVHLLMLAYALAHRRSGEALGQVLRVVLAPIGSWLGRAPLGNTGRASVGILEPMPIAPELAAKLGAAGYDP